MDKSQDEVSEAMVRDKRIDGILSRAAKTHPREPGQGYAYTWHQAAAAVAEALAMRKAATPSVEASDEGLAELCERLRATEGRAADFVGDPNPRYVTCWHRNPDGPEAADTITRLNQRVAKLERALERCLNHPLCRLDGSTEIMALTALNRSNPDE